MNKAGPRALRLKVIHHKDDAVAVTVVLHGRDVTMVRFPPLRGMSQAQAADIVTQGLVKLNAAIQRAIQRDASSGPTSEVDPTAGPCAGGDRG